MANSDNKNRDNVVFDAADQVEIADPIVPIFRKNSL